MEPKADSNSSAPTSSKAKSMMVPLCILLLVVGLAAGYLISKAMSPASMTPPAPEVNQKTGQIALPPDAVRIQGCSDHRGSLYVKPSDIPVGPVYMVNNGKVIGIEYMLAKDEFLTGKSFKELQGLGISVDHVNIGLLSQGHEGYTIPHYHVDMYTVPKSVEDSITCPSGTPSTATPSAKVATPSATSASSSATKP